ncbi:Beta-barrel assembly machine subunit BamB [Nitrosospira sp. Nsp2]|nr:Beta-barrel assembly machine subunit BamB [Nitrosospira sp. Nsp2]
MPSGKPVSNVIRQHIVLGVSIFALSGCAGVTELARDVITGLADIDVSGVTDLFGGGKVELSPEQTAQLVKIPPARPLWRNALEESQAAVFFPVFENGAVYAASTEGRLVRFNSASGKEEGTIDTKGRLSGGIGTGENMLMVGTFKGEVLAYDRENGKPLWTAQVSSEVLSPPQAAGGMVVVRAGDGRIFGLEAGSGKRKWVYQGATPSLTVRNFAGVLISGDTVYSGFAGGKLVTINLSNGVAGWEAVVARPRGATELERIADITSPPMIDEQQVCAVAYQGRVACFEIGTGNQLWAKDVSSNAGLAMDNNYVYVSENRGSISAYDKRDGTSIWKQELLNGMKLSPPLLQGNHIVVGDSQGHVNVIKSENGDMISRSASDDSPIVTRPVSLPNGFAVQTRKGGIFAFGL